MAAPGSLVAGRYRLLRQLGAGGMGVVWEARDERLHRAVAVKQLRTQNGLSDAETSVFAERAMREARITARLQHPYAVSVFDVVEDEGKPCLVMELVPSVPLSEVLRELGTLEPTEAARVGSQVAAALAAAHALGIVHRDVKPGNILIGDDDTARICDFGISRAPGDTTLTMTGMITGTPAYLAPEVARGEEAGPAADVHSLGATLYAAVEGVPPFGSDGNAIAVLYRVTSGSMRPPERAGALGPLLLGMMSGRPQDRPTMAEAARVLAGLADGEAMQATEAAPVDEPATPLLLPAPRPAAPPLPVAPTVVAEQTSRPAPTAHGEQRTPTATPSRRPRWLLPAGLVALVVLIGIVLAALWSSGADPTAGSSPGAGLTSVPSPSPSPTATASSPGQPTADQLAQAVVDYYALLPDDTDAGWQLLTPAYQQQTGGRDSYEKFWNDVDSVTVSDVRGTLPDQVRATISYVLKSGNQRSTERRSFQLVESDGTLKINKSAVI